jgi:hypothetical protein
MSVKLTSEEIRLLELIAGSFNENKKCTDHHGADPSRVLNLATCHAIAPIIYDPLKGEELSTDDRAMLESSVMETASKFFKLLFLARDTIRILEEGGVSVILLKGASVASLYPVPEYRRSSDVDLLLADPADVSTAGEILAASGYRLMHDDYEANHHQTWGSPNNHVIELHTTLVEPFDNRSLNSYINTRYLLGGDDIRRLHIMGADLPVFFDDRQALHLMLHMMMDFYRSGFGLKLLCDWVVFWNRILEPKYIETFIKDVRSCHAMAFLSVITSSCIRYLGLKSDKSCSLYIQDDKICYQGGSFCEYLDENICLEFLSDVIDAERHGKPDATRMVAMKKAGLGGLIKEYHHQTVLSFPKASRAIITLPFLYLVMLIRFLKNNRTTRGGISTRDIIDESMKRSRMIKRIEDSCKDP